MNAKHLGNQIGERRRALGLTQQALAATAQVGRRTVIELEAGEADIGLRRLLRITAALGLDLALHPAATRPSEDQLRDIFRNEDDVP